MTVSVGSLIVHLKGRSQLEVSASVATLHEFAYHSSHKANNDFSIVVKL
jgi:hypothetical protein